MRNSPPDKIEEVLRTLYCERADLGKLIQHLTWYRNTRSGRIRQFGQLASLSDTAKNRLVRKH
jgi:hypothetical protein